MGLFEMLLGEEPGLIAQMLHYENVGQFGEYLTEFALTNHNISGKFEVLKNVYVPYKGKTAEIDLIMIHEQGIFVFESKNYSGWIFGSAEQLNWTQALQGGRKNQFYNPVRQNRTHISALSAYLGINEELFFSYIIFSERCTLKKVPPDTDKVTIVQRPDMLGRLRKHLTTLPVLLKPEEITKLTESLRTIAMSGDVQEKHIEEIKRSQEGTVCPFCGGTLVLRKGKYGEFWGCSAYPRCKFTRKTSKKSGD